MTNTAQAAELPEPETLLGTSLSLPDDAPAIDLILSVRLVPSQEALAGHALRFELTAPQPALKLQEELFGPLRLATDPRAGFEAIFGQFASTDLDREQAARAFCAERGDELLPRDLRELLWDLSAADQPLRSLWISSDEMWVPWELLGLGIAAGEGRDAHTTLGERFAVTRGRPSFTRQPWLPLHRIGAVIGVGAGLDKLSAEASFLKGLRSEARSVELLPTDRDALLEHIETGGYDGLHLASHGGWSEGARFSIVHGESELTPGELIYAAPSLAATRPLVFVNACHLGRSERGIVHWHGWAAQLLERNIGAFVGALWPINVRAARIFTESFYGQFLKGATLAVAVRDARLAVRDAMPDDTSWLAFVAYGDPSARCRPAPTDAEDPPGGENPVSIAEPPRLTVPPAAEKRTASIPSRRGVQLAMSIIALLAVAFVVLTTVRVPTRVRLEARVGQLGLTVADSKRGRALQILDETLPIHGLELRRFSRAEIDTNRGEEAPLAPWVFRAQTLAATLSVETPVPSLPHDRSSASQISALQDLALTPGDQLVLRAQRLGDDFDVGLDLARSQPLVLPLLNSVAVTATDVEQLLPESMATPQPGSASPMLYADPSPTARLIIYPGTLSLDIAMVVGGVRTGSRILWSEPLPVSSVDFIRSERDGTWRSTLLAEVALHRLDAPWLPPVEVPRDHFLSMDRLRDFQVRRLALDDASGGLVATLEGRVGLFKSGAAGKVRDLRLTAYERWLGNDRWSGLMVWLAGTTSVMFGAARFWQQRRRAA